MSYGNRCRLRRPHSIGLRSGAAISLARGSPPKGDLIALTERSSDNRWAVVVVDLIGKRRVISDGWRRLQGIVWAPAGGEIWFNGGQTTSGFALHAVTLSGQQRLVARMPGKVGVSDISRDGRVLVEQDLMQTSMMG